MTREETERQFALMTLSAYRKCKSKQDIISGIGIVVFLYLMLGFLLAIPVLHSKEMVIILAILLIITIIGDLFFLTKTISKKGCSRLYVLWDMLSMYVLSIICGFGIMYMISNLYKLDDKSLHTLIIMLIVSMILSAVVEIIVDKIYIKNGKLQTKLENIKGPGGAVIYAIVSLLTSYTPNNFAQMVYFLGGIIAGTYGTAMISKIFYRLYLIKKHNLWDYFGYFH